MKKRLFILLALSVLFGSLMLPKAAQALVVEATDLVGSSNFGSAVDVCKGKTVEFPWWLVILIALCDAIIIRIFYPIRKKCKKLHKKC